MSWVWGCLGLKVAVGTEHSLKWAGQRVMVCRPNLARFSPPDIQKTSRFAFSSIHHELLRRAVPFGGFREFSPQTKSYGLAQIPPWFYPRIRAGPPPFVFGCLLGRLPTGMHISTPKKGETHVIFYWPFRGAHLRPECAISTPKMGGNARQFFFGFFLVPFRFQMHLAGSK
jgi:hypothetical protein